MVLKYLLAVLKLSVVVVVFGYLLICILLWFYQDYLIYPMSYIYHISLADSNLLGRAAAM